MTRVLVVMPTYNEIGNLHSMLDRIHASNPEVEVLVVDDNSPDGTGKAALERSQEDAWVHVLQRSAKSGLGAAYRAGFSWGIERGYEVLVEMDADGSHQPEQLPLLLAALKDADLVLGSRWIRGGSVVNWPLSRKLLSLGGNFYTRLMLGIPIKDATGGFRAFTVDAVRKIQLLDRDTQGYIFQVENTYLAVKRGLKVVEVPIEFVERVVGTSKMSRAIVIEALARVTIWGLRNRILRQPLI